MFKKILLAFDGSNTSLNAANYAMHLSSLEQAQLIFLNVIENIKQGGVIGLRAKFGDLKLVEGYTNARKKNAEEWIKPIEKSAKDKGINTKVEILEDDMNSLTGFIINYAEKNNIDLIVIGTKGQSKFRRLVMGSVASGIIHHSKCPVLLIK